MHSPNAAGSDIVNINVHSIIRWHAAILPNTETETILNRKLNKLA